MRCYQKTSKINQFIRFSKEVLNSRHFIFFGRKEEEKKEYWTSYKDILQKNLKVGILAQVIYPPSFWKIFPNENLQINSHLSEFHNMVEGWKALLNKKADFVVVDKERGLADLRREKLENSIVAYHPVLFIKEYYAVFSKASKYPNKEELEKKFNRALYKLMESGSLTEINESWLKK